MAEYRLNSARKHEHNIRNILSGKNVLSKVQRETIVNGVEEIMKQLVTSTVSSSRITECLEKLVKEVAELKMLFSHVSIIPNSRIPSAPSSVADQLKGPSTMVSTASTASSTASPIPVTMSCASSAAVTDLLKTPSPMVSTASTLPASFSAVLTASARTQASPTVARPAIIQNSSASPPPELTVVLPSSPPVRQNYDDVLLSSPVTQIRKSTSRATRRIIRGTGGSDNLLVAAQRRKWIHVFYLKKDTSEKTLVDYVKQKLPSCDPVATKLTTKGDYSSFKVSIPEDNLNDILCPQMWPSGVGIGRWKFRRSVVPSPAQGTQ
jgi:hypothetical protein